MQDFGQIDEELMSAAGAFSLDQVELFSILVESCLHSRLTEKFM